MTDAAVRPRAMGVAVPVLIGVAASAAMLAVYLAIVSLAQGWVSAVELLGQDAYLVAPITASFGLQVGLYAYLRAIVRIRTRSGAALTGASGGTSTVAMVACCAHRVADLIPVLGLSAAAGFLAAYKVPFMIVGLGVSLTGVALMVRRVVRHKRNMRFPEREEVVMAKMVKDPVCGMDVEPARAAATRTHEGQTFHFCSQGCAKTFDSDPHRYGHPTGAHAGH